MIPKVVESTLDYLAHDNQVLKDYRIIGDSILNSTTIILRYTTVDMLQTRVKARNIPFVKHKSPAQVNRDINRTGMNGVTHAWENNKEYLCESTADCGVQCDILKTCKTVDKATDTDKNITRDMGNQTGVLIATKHAKVGCDTPIMKSHRVQTEKVQIKTTGIVCRVETSTTSAQTKEIYGTGEKQDAAVECLQCPSVKSRHIQTDVKETKSRGSTVKPSLKCAETNTHCFITESIEKAQSDIKEQMMVSKKTDPYVLSSTPSWRSKSSDLDDSGVILFMLTCCR
jgi:hypothetical protein